MTTARPRMDYSAPRAYEDRIAPRYAPAADELIAAAELLAGDRVLEVGAGTGLVTRRATELVEPAGLVVATDRSAAMLDVAQQLSAGALYIELDYLEPLPLLEGSFDAVLSGLTYVQDDAAAVAELARVLRPGGRLALTMWAEDYLELRLMNEAKRALGVAEIPPPAPDAACRRLEAAGFEHATRRDFELEPEYASADEYINYRRGFGVPAGSTPADHDRYLEELGRLAEQHAEADGTFKNGWVFSLITARMPRYP